jgi:hypothetical protein
VSDIDDAPIVTAEDNKELLASNVEKKAKLNVAKTNLSGIQTNIRTLGPLVEQGVLYYLMDHSILRLTFSGLQITTN